MPAPAHPPRTAAADRTCRAAVGASDPSHPSVPSTPQAPSAPSRRRALRVIGAGAAALAGAAGCAGFDTQQREWIFDPRKDDWWGGRTAARGMDDVWIRYASREDGEAVTLHGLWLAADAPQAPVMLLLHGARWNVTGSAPRMRRLQSLGFSVLAIDYRGFGRSSGELPSEQMTYEDAQAAWDWLGRHDPGRPRYVYGHSLGSAVAIELATQVDDVRGVIVEGSFTSIADVAGSMRWGWLPFSWLITQRFDSASRIGRIKAPLLVVHGSEDHLIAPRLGRELYDLAPGPKAFILVDGASHHDALALGIDQYRTAIRRLFALGGPPGGPPGSGHPPTLAPAQPGGVRPPSS